MTTTPEQLQEVLERKREMGGITTEVPVQEQQRTVELICMKCGDAFTLDGMTESPFVVQGADAFHGALCRTCYLKARNEPVAPSPHGFRDNGSADVLRMMEMVGINVRRHGLLTLERLGDGPARVAADKFVDEVMRAGRYGEVGSLYIWGPTGTGKSQLAVCIVRSLMRRYWNQINEKSVVYDRARAMVTQLQDRYTTGRVDEFSEVRRRARLWVYEDAGTEKLTADSFRVMEDLFDRREGHATIVTSNLSRSELSDRWGGFDGQDRFRSRLAPFAAIQLAGGDRRVLKV